MAGFGSLGGLGGTGGLSYNSRMGMPNSQNIQTLDEAHKEIWDEYERQREAERRASASLNDSVYDRYADVPNMTDAQKQAAYQALSRTAKSGAANGNAAAVGYGFADNPVGDVHTYQYGKAWEDRAVQDQSFQQRADAATADFTERGLRQQQNYDSMSGWNQQNGMIGPEYTDPNFGQVSGLARQAMPNVPGVGMDWTKGLSGTNGNGANGNWAGTFGAPQGQTGVYGAPMQQRRWGL